MTTPTKQQDKDLAAINTHLSEIVSSVNTIQGSVHSVLVMASIYGYKYDNADIAATVLNNLTGVRGSFRVESVAYWLKHIAGFNVAFNEKLDKYTAKFCKAGEYASSHGVKFTFDKAHVSTLKEDKFRFWKIAPVVIKELKLQDDLEKVTASAEIQLARSFAAGNITEAAIAAHVAKMLQRVKTLAESGKTKSWLEDFYLQHPDQRPVVEIDPIEKELAELEAAELKAGLEEVEVE
jgi:hypothetical protein